MRDYSFGNFLHELRVRPGLSQFQLGMLVGVSNKAVSKWENGSAKPQSRILYKLAKLYGSMPPMEVANRYYSEYAELKNTDQILYFDFLSRMGWRSKAEGIFT